ncbi:MAG: hypothetical protein IPK07_05800 [Deltaproteobacteria bacterium]|nr:hypothetical protein [Deltaproteobacteria bacterium]
MPKTSRVVARAAALLAILLSLTGDRAGAAGPEPAATKNLRGEWLSLVSYPAQGGGLFFMKVVQSGTSLVVSVDGYTNDAHGPIGAGLVLDKNVVIQMDENFKPSGLGQTFLGKIVGSSLLIGTAERGGTVGSWIAIKNEAGG